MKVGIAQFAAHLRDIRTEEFTPARLNPILENLDLHANSVEQYVQWREGGYTRNLVYSNGDFELLVLCWDAGSISAIHDHAGQQCWFVAHSGAFDVENFDLAAGGKGPGHAKVVPTSTDRGIISGMPDYRAPGPHEIHRVSVPSETGRAISIHVYAKPLAQCLFFDEVANVCFERRSTYDNIQRERILVA